MKTIKNKIIQSSGDNIIVFMLQCVIWYREFVVWGSKYKKQYYNQPRNRNVLKHTFVYLSSGYNSHEIGGLADRIKGMMELYDWCRRHNRDFRIFFTDPFPLQNYLVPNSYQWIIDERQVSFNHRDAAPKYLASNIRMSETIRVKKSAQFFNFCMSRFNIYPNKQLHFSIHYGLESYDWAQRYHELFKPAPGLQERIEFHKKAIGGKYISISFRFTTLLGDLGDCVNSELPETEKRQLIDRCKNEIFKIESENPHVEHVLVASDSISFVNEAKLLPKVYVVPGEIGHIVYDKTNDDSTMKTFLDLYMIMGAEKSYLVKFGDMYDSRFPYLACKVSGRELIVRTDN